MLRAIDYLRFVETLALDLTRGEQWISAIWMDGGCGEIDPLETWTLAHGFADLRKEVEACGVELVEIHFERRKARGRAQESPAVERSIFARWRWSVSAETLLKNQ